MTKHYINIIGLTILALAITGFATAAFANGGSVRNSLNNIERISLMVEEDRTIPTYVRINEAYNPSEDYEATETPGRPLTSASVRDTMTADEEKTLSKEEDRTIREYELISWKDTSETSMGKSPEAYHKPHVSGSVRANLNDDEKKVLAKEEDRVIREFE